MLKPIMRRDRTIYPKIRRSAYLKFKKQKDIKKSNPSKIEKYNAASKSKR
jgi:hypothetical protein